MQLTNLLATDDERAVSPVIGVILMVAITVILAAVIGAFVLGIGGDQEQAPQATLSLDCDDSDEIEDIDHRGGDDIDLDDVSTPSDGVFDNADEVISTGQSFQDVDGDVDYAQLDDAGAITIVHDPSDSIIFDRSC